MRAGLGLILTVLGVAASDDAASFTKAPKLLSQTGLYAQATATVAAGNRPYAPQYPLWSDGATKARWVFLPRGARIDAKDPDNWDFPVGTKFWKEFAFGGQKVETRLMWKTGPRSWSYASYDWKADGSDALLAPDSGVKNRFPLAGGKQHAIPSVADCKRCHENGGGEVLGFTALQLSPDRDPLALHAEPVPVGGVTLQTLAEGGLLVPARAEWVKDPPRIRAANPRTRAVLGYLSSNCGSCHQTQGPVADKGLFLRHLTAKAGSAEPALATTLHKEGKWRIPGALPGASRLIKPGAPAESSLLQRTKLRGTLLQMPPLASVLVDEAAIALIHAWIAEDLKPNP